MTDNFKEIGSLFGREGAGAGFAKQTDKESFTYAFAWPEGDTYRIPLLKVLLREQLESRYEVANHFSTMNRARVELSAFIQNEGGAPLPEDALGTPEEQGIRAILLATDAYDTPLIAGIKPDGTGNYGEREVETNMVLSVYSRQNFIRYFALLRDMDAFVFVSGRKIEALEDLSGLPLAENCSGLDIDRILQRPKCLG